MRGFARGCLLVLGLSGVAGAVRASGVSPELLGRPVLAVAYTADGPVDDNQVRALVAIRPGASLSDEETSATIRNLFGTLAFSNILIQAEAAGDSVVVTVHLWRAFRVTRISFDGKAALPRDEMRRAIPFSEGDPFNGAALSAGASSLERRLATSGYLHPSVDPEAEFDPATFGVTIDYRIDAGPRSSTAAPFFDGDTGGFSAEILAREGKIKVGKPYDEARARSAAERMRKYLLEQGRLRASVELIAAEPTESGEIRPVYRIAVGPAYEFVASGIKPKQFRKEIVALAEGQGMDPDLLQQWAEDTKARLQREGHYRARVTTSSGGTDPVVLTAAVDAGPTFSVEKVSFSGNPSVSDETLQGLMITRPKGLPLIQKGRLEDSELDDDVSAILGYYQTHGWIDAKVERPSVSEGSKPGLLLVGIAIVEGSRVFVAGRRVEGAEHLTPAEIDKTVTVAVGNPFNPIAARQDAGALTSLYRNTGWREASVQDKVTISPDRTKADVVYVVVEGERTFFGKTILRGNERTRPSRVLRQVAWKEGEPFSEQKVAETQQNLARTGAFRTTQIRPLPPDPETQEQNIDVDLTEARRLSLLYGVGYQYAQGASQPSDPFATAGVTYRNLFGSLVTASLQVQYAPVTRRGYIIANLVEPYLFGTDIPLSVGVLASRQPIQKVDIDRVGAFAEAVRLFGHLRIGLRYEYQQIKPENPENLSNLDKADQPIKESAIGPSFLYDRRDDVLDPHSGYYWTVAGKYAFPFLQADANFGKVSGQVAYFQPFLGGVVAAAFRIGAIYNLDASVPVPTAERFFAGGSSTARGFSTDVEGIPDVTVDPNTQATPAATPGKGTCAPTYTFPGAANYDCEQGPFIIGGNGFMAWGFEYRLRLFGDLGLSVFYDLAQVWALAHDVHFEIEGKTGLRQSVGIGLHYMTPIGPLRLEYSRPVELRTIPYAVTTKVDDEPPIILQGGLTTKETGRVFLSIGYPF